MLTNCEYDKIKILHDLEKIEWFLAHHAKKDAEKEDERFLHMCESLQQDIARHAEVIKSTIVISK